MARKSKFTRIPPERQKNPNSLRELLKAIREEFSAVSQPAFAALLNDVGRPFRAKQLEGHTIGKIERDQDYIRYLHIEKYAEFLGIPSGLLLLFSRMLANDRDGNITESNKELAAKIVAVMRLIDDSTVIDIEELKKWRSHFEPSLFNNTSTQKPKS